MNLKSQDLLVMAAIIGAVLFVWLLLRFLRYLLFSLPKVRLSPSKAYRRRTRLIRAVRVWNWFAFFAVLFAIMGGFAGVIGLFLWLATLVVALMAYIRHREMERRSLLWLLAVATERGIPLDSAMQTFADERNDAVGYRAHLLAEALRQGLPLDQAFRASSNRLPNDALIAVRTGCATGGLPMLLKNAVRNSATVDAAVHAAIARVMYLITFLFFTGAMLAFMTIKIVPAYIKIFQDFKTTLPAPTLALIHFFYTFHRYPELAAALLLILLFVLLFAVARYVGLARWDPPLVRRITLPLDESLVLRSLSESVAEQKPLTVAFTALSDQYPKRYIRRRLQTAEKNVSQGMNWCDSLEASELLTAPDAGVLKAAERTGNLAWAMNYTADRQVRRFTTRLWAVVSIGFPAALLVVGAFVLWLAVGFFLPLVKLIHDLAH
jgi:type II secretory pathway component PulF